MTCHSKTQTFTSNGTWTAPPGVSAVFVTMVGGGSGTPGGSDDPRPIGGGGTGELVTGWPVAVVSGDTYSVTVGSKGIGVAYSTQPTPAGDSTFNGFSALKAGAYRKVFGADNGGSGGGCGGSEGFFEGNGFDPKGQRESGRWFGGTGGGGGDIYTDPAGVHGGPIAVKGSGARPGGPGGGSLWGGTTGGNYDTGNNHASATHYGAGGGGSGAAIAGTNTGGDGAGGYVILMWVE